MNIISTNRNILRRAEKLWNLIVVSIVIDAVIISRDANTTIPSWIYKSNVFLTVFLVIPTLYLFLPNFQRLSLMLHSKYPKQKVYILPILFLIPFLIPLVEITLRFKSLGLIGGFVLIFSIVLIGKQLFHFKKGFTAGLPPRNRFFHIKRVDLMYEGGFIVSLLSARALSLLGAFLYFYKAVSDLYFVIFEGAALLLILLLKPSVQRFYSLCPNCRSFRSKALDGLSLCPACSRKTFRS